MGVSGHFMPGVPDLSARALSIWAKSIYLNPQDEHYLQLWQHLEDTGEVALHVWDEFVPDNAKTLLVEDIGDECQARTLYWFISSIHDIGKASPAFVVQVPRLADKIRQSGLSIDYSISGDELRLQYRHELVGCWSLESWFAQQSLHTGEGTLAHGIASIVAGHHGTSLTQSKQELRNCWRYERFAGDSSWEAVRREIIDWFAKSTEVIPVLQNLHERPLRRRTQIILTSLVIIADWIASDSRLCTLNEPSLDNKDERRF